MFDMTHLRAKNVHFMTSLMDLKYDARLHSLLALWLAWAHRTSVMREFSASRHFFKTNVTQSVAELILYSQKTRNCGHFLSNLVN